MDLSLKTLTPGYKELLVAYMENHVGIQEKSKAKAFTPDGFRIIGGTHLYNENGDDVYKLKIEYNGDRYVFSITYDKSELAYDWEDHYGETWFEKI